MQKPAHQARGALANPEGRFETYTTRTEDDGWWREEDLPPLRTTVTEDSTRTIIAHNDSPDISFDRSINPYRGCEHGCIYCYARPSHNYLGLSAGTDFETKLFAKPRAGKLLEEELRKKGYSPAPIGLGTNTDPYQPVERKLGIIRQILEVLAAFNHPLTIVTKSALILRDLDILGPMAAKGLVSVGISVTSLDGDLARRLEPRASVPAKRLAAIEGLAAAGVPVRVMVAPLIPALTDHELESILTAAAKAGATKATWILLRLPYDIKDLFGQWLEHHRPERAAHILSLVRQARGGKLNDPEFGKRFRGEGPYVEMIGKRFAVACRKLGLNEAGRGSTPLRTDLFKPPARAGDQLALDLGPP
jgi:DNA repair photolyase